ncbi:hypothetical protein GCM10022402_33530 [Salinactinospora qingdaonensis]|uniref:Uncharacterized protein n=1 Tax=Salinactinospora qingdaonensis TaxID=702744 RepID=A0ABP7G1R9_9ACTN
MGGFPSFVPRSLRDLGSLRWAGVEVGRIPHEGAVAGVGVAAQRLVGPSATTLTGIAAYRRIPRRSGAVVVGAFWVMRERAAAGPVKRVLGRSIIARDRDIPCGSDVSSPLGCPSFPLTPSHSAPSSCRDRAAIEARANEEHPPQPPHPSRPNNRT